MLLLSRLRVAGPRLRELGLVGLCLAGSLSVSFVGAASAQTSNTTTVAGSLEGEFAVDDSGAATYSLPVSVPPGIAGNEPRLALSYSSQAGNGPLGVGWGLSGLSAITRCGQRLVPHGKIHGVDFSAADRFCLDGQRLVAVSGDYGADGTEYRTEIESYAKVISNDTAGTGPASFTVWSKGGLVLEYGVTDDSRIEAIKADGTARSEARIWALNKQSDRSDNAITYSYIEDQTNGSYSINRIDYGGNDTAGTTATSSVRFIYEDRTDIRTWYQAGAKVTQNKRLKNIQIYEAETLVADYRVEYDDEVLVGNSHLVSLEQCSDTDCLKPLLFGYDVSQSDGTYEPFVHTTGGGLNYSAGYTRHFHDVNGDGLVDLTLSYINSDDLYIYTYISKGDGTYEPFVHTTGGGLNYSAGYTRHFHDVNGDGLVDLTLSYINSDDLYIYTYISKGDGTYEPFVHTTGGGLNYSAGYTRHFHDVNGDGLVDLTLSYINSDDLYIYTYISKGDGTYEPFVHTTGGGLNYSAGYTRHFHDVNGDGLVDLTLSYINSDDLYIYTYISKGDGTYEPFVHTTGGGLNYSAGYTRHFHDVNGDGLVDLTLSYINSDDLYIYTYISKGDGTYEPFVHTTGGGLNYSAGYTRHFHDVNGDGLVDLTLSYINSDDLYIYTYISKGDGTYEPFVHTTGGGLNYSAGYTRHFHDVNGDGLVDLTLSYINSDDLYIYTYISKGDGTYEPFVHTKGGGLNYSVGYAPDFHDVNGDGLVDMTLSYINSHDLYIYTYISKVKNSFQKLNQITFSRGHQTSISYTPLTDKLVYSKGSDAVYPEQDYVSSLSVVQSVERDDGIGGKRKIEYSYAGAKVDVKRGSFLGFKQITSKDVQRETETITDYRQDWPFVRRVVSVTRQLVSGTDNSDNAPIQGIMGTLNKVSGGTAWNAGANSSENFTGAGSLSVVARANTYWLVGLSSTAGDSSDASIEFGLYQTTNDTISVYESGQHMGAFGNYSIGDILSVERTATGVIHYKKNDVTIYTSTKISSPEIALLVDASLYHVGTTLGDVKLSSGGGEPQSVHWITDNSIEVIPINSDSPVQVVDVSDNVKLISVQKNTWEQVPQTGGSVDVRLKSQTSKQYEINTTGVTP
ncbi:FG-GAP-like repeat-containing protein [Kiloniella majae]|uniref:FG-GAP-like repeat-containing protein n=1 Tax=Kiloniella majae TaxID=1938558 RepID=UPI000A278BBE|nr:FG-GAP-like repeat-containing protein [Kiloniella majae]